ncbi:DNA polymerase I [Fusobacterium sp. MFO224]|uniref:DNA polymerase I n=1 Tax=Fusobacterium sp. MFO224 TaxID=3378070 RepID=UPI003855621E
MKKIVLLDTSAIMYRAFYANMNFRTKNEPTGAVYGFTNILLSVIKQFSPDFIGAAKDVKRATLKRSEVYEEYKKDRQAMPEDLVTQLPRIDELLDSFGIGRYKINGYEADDVIGTISKKFSKEGYEVFIITGDKDLAQLVDKNINICLMGKGEDGGFKIISNDEDVIEHLGVPADKIPDLFGLIGDKSDGIPGVRKVGPKKAIPMLKKYGDLEGIYENVDHLRELPGIGPGLIKNIVEDKELAFLSRKLAVIKKDIDLDIKIEDLEFHMNREKLLALFKELGFRALIKRMKLNEIPEEVEEVKETEEIKASSEKKSVEDNSSQLGLFFGNAEVKEEPKEKVFQIISTEEELDSLIKDLKNEERIYFYQEGPGMSLVTKKGNHYIPLFHNLKLGETHTNLDKKYLEKIFNLDKKFVTYDFKNILKNIYKLPVDKMDLDEMLAYHLITSETRVGIEAIAMREGIEGIDKYSEVFKKEIPENIGISDFSNYLNKRANLIKEVYKDLVEDLQNKNLLEVLQKIEMPLIEVLNNMEENGILINKDYFSKMSIQVGKLLDKTEKKVYEIAGEEFNLNSPKQLAEILFFKLNIDPVKKTKTGYSTNSEVLEVLNDRGEEIAKYILEYRKFSKLKSTYLDALPKTADKDNVIHTTFNQTGTATGRLSSSDPNLQNIPVKTEDGIEIREGFIASPGYKLLGIDYSQIELRVLAEISKDENLIKAYRADQDLHSLTARRIFDLSDDDKVTPKQRSMAKIVNFSIIYGKTPFGLSKELKITRAEATSYIDRYFEEYPRVKKLEEEIIENAVKTGYSETYFKRRRDIEGINSKNKNLKNQADRMAVNTVIQGTAAEIIKKVMIEVYNEIKDKEDIKMLLQVHDELIFQVKEDRVKKYKTIIEDIMENTVHFENVQLKVNGAIGENWAETK